MLSQRSPIILQGAGVCEIFNLEWGLALSLNTYRRKIQSGSVTKFSILRIPTSRSVGAGLKDQKNASHVIQAIESKDCPMLGLASVLRVYGVTGILPILTGLE